MADVTTKHVADYLALKVNEDHVSPTTVLRYREALHAFFEWARSLGYCVRNPVDDVPRPRLADRDVRFLTLADIEVCLRAVKCDIIEPVVATAIYAGLRREELCWLTRDDIDFADGRRLIRVRGIEAKFGSPLGVPVHQLPREFAVAADLSAEGTTYGGKDFLLLVVTQGYAAPRIRAPLDIDVARRVVEGHQRKDIASVLGDYFRLATARTRDEALASRLGKLIALVPEHVAWIGWFHLAQAMHEGLRRIEGISGLDWMNTLRASSSRLARRGLRGFSSRGIVSFGGFAGWPAPACLRAYGGERLLLDIEG